MYVHTTTAPDRTGDRPAPDAAFDEPPAPAVVRRYVPGLTGLRTLALVGVLLTAGGHRWLPGGELAGVEVFAVLSGYLTVATLRIREHRVTAGDVLRRCGTRARRVLPALLVLLGGASLLVLVWRPDELYRLGGDIRATLLGVVNWHLIVEAAEPDAAPSMVTHLWALAVGTQATVLILAAMVFVRSPRARAVAIGVAALAAVAVAVTVAVVVSGGPTEVGPDILYRTDVRGVGVLLGAALGLTVHPAGPGGVVGVRGRRLRAIGVLALVGLGAVAVVGGPRATWVGQGGLLVTDVLAVLAVAAVVRGAPLRLLHGAAAQWLGLRAYAMYLWHWPVVMVLGGPAAVSRPLPTAVYVLAVLLLGDLTYRYVEVPLAGTWRVRGTGAPGRPVIAAAVAALACGAAAAAALLGPAPAA